MFVFYLSCAVKMYSGGLQCYSQSWCCCGNRHQCFCRRLLIDLWLWDGNFDVAPVHLSGKCTHNAAHLIHVCFSVYMFECFLFSKVFSLWISEDCCAIFTTKSSKSASQQAGVTCRNSLGSYSPCKHTSACAATTGVSSLISLNKTQALK